MIQLASILAARLDILPYAVWAAFGGSKPPKPCKLEEYLLKFGMKREEQAVEKTTQEQEVALSKAAWGTALGMAPGTVEVEEVESTLPEPYRARPWPKPGGEKKD